MLAPEVAAAGDGLRQRRVEAAPEDEIHEEEQMHVALVVESGRSQSHGRVWARQLRGRFGVPDWGNASVVRSFGLTTSCTDMGSVLALQEVLPTGTLRVLTMLDAAFKSEPTTSSALNLTRQNCKSEHLFVDFAAATAGGEARL